MEGNRGISVIKMMAFVVLIMVFTRADVKTQASDTGMGLMDDPTDPDCDDSSEEQNETTVGIPCSKEVDDGGFEPEVVPLGIGMMAFADDPMETVAGIQTFGDPSVPMDGVANGPLYNLKMRTVDIANSNGPPLGSPTGGVLTGLDDAFLERNDDLRGIVGLRGSSLPVAPPGGLLGDTKAPPKLYETVGADVPLVVLKNDSTYKRIREETKYNQILSLDNLVALTEETTRPPARIEPPRGSYTMTNTNAGGTGSVANAIPMPDEYAGYAVTNTGVNSVYSPDAGYAVTNTGTNPVYNPDTGYAVTNTGANPAYNPEAGNSLLNVDVISLDPIQNGPYSPSLLDLITRGIKRRKL